VIADITEHEIDLIEIGKMIDDFGAVRRGGTGRLRRGGYRKDGTSAGKPAAKILRLCIVSSLTASPRA
jgi:hypothetical protein